MIRSLFCFACVSAAALLALSCSTHKNEPTATPGATSPVRVQGVKRTNLHWVQGEQLQALMKTLSSQAQNLPKAPPADTEGRPAGAATFTQAAALADSLASAAQRIPLAIEGVDLGEADRRAFVVFAQTLGDQAATLKKWANARDLEEMRRTFNSITNTCSSCHIRYRDLSGDLWPPRAHLLNVTPPIASARSPLIDPPNP